jgi:thiosulfate/3-mercaptopyruvate sulfurtransferase
MSSLTPLVSGSEAVALYEKGTKFIDATWFLKSDEDPNRLFHSQAIPGAVYFDIDKVADTSSSLPHMLPNKADFELAMSNLSIKPSDHVVIYTQPGSFASARVWWTLRVFGHESVSILDGGIEAWKAAGGTIISGTTPEGRQEGTYRIPPHRQCPDFVANWQQILNGLDNPKIQVCDARPTGRWLGIAPEPRAGLKSGRVPLSVSLPATSVLDPQDVTKFLPVEELRARFTGSGIVIDGSKRIIFTCGSGVTAAVLSFAHFLVSSSDPSSSREPAKTSVYDGSWSEWGSLEGVPRVTEPAEEVSLETFLQRKKAAFTGYAVYKAAWCPDCSGPVLPDIQAALGEEQILVVDVGQRSDYTDSKSRLGGIGGVPSIERYCAGTPLARLEAGRTSAGVMHESVKNWKASITK